MITETEPTIIDLSYIINYYKIKYKRQGSRTLTFADRISLFGGKAWIDVQDNVSGNCIYNDQINFLGMMHIIVTGKIHSSLYV